VRYKLIYTKSAVKDIKKLDSVAQKRIKKKIEEYAQKPFFYAKKLLNKNLGDYRWRVGNYRVVFDIKKRNIIILRIGHRKEIYK